MNGREYFVEPTGADAGVIAPAREPALAAVGAVANGAGEAVSATLLDARPTEARVAQAVAGAQRVRVPVSSGFALVVAVALTLLMIVIASPLDGYAQAAASALLR